MDFKNLKNKKIILIALIAVVVIAAGIITAVLLLNGDSACKEHVDGNADGKCDVCGKDISELPDTPNYEDKVEAISKCYITAKEGEGYAVTAPEYVIKGSELSFTVTFSNYFDSTNAAVKVNGSAVTPDASGKYSVKNVENDVEIEVSGITRTHYGVAKIACLGAKIVGDDKIAVNGNYSFTLDISDNASGTPVVTANGETITAVDGVYTVTGQNKNLIIEVTGLTVPTVEVTYDTNSGYSVESEPVAIGGTLHFSVHIDNTHENHRPLVVKANGVTLESVNGVYTVQNAPATVNISVDGVTLRETITISFGNCDLAPVSIYKATVWQEITPVREGYIFNGWTDLFGYPVDFNYMSDITLYASWLTEDGINYVNQLPVVAKKIKDRYENIKNASWKMNVSDRELADLYKEMLGHHTELELSFISSNKTVEAFLAAAEYISARVVGKNNYYGAQENAVKLFYMLDGELTYMGASNLRSLSNGDDMNGVRYNIQKKNGAGEIILDYSLDFGKYNFKELCDEYGKVTFWLSTNATGLTAETGGELLFGAEMNNVVASGGSCALYRIDIQDGMLFVNTEYLFDLSESAYNGEEDFVISVHRLDDSTHQYAYIQVSDVYVGANDPSLEKVIKTSETFKIAGMLTATYIDPVDGLSTYPSRTDVSALLEGDKYNIQKPSSSAANIVLDYDFTIKAFNYKRYCEKYGSVSFKVAGNYTGMTVSVDSSQALTLTADTPLTITIQNGSIYANGVYISELSEDVYNGTSALVMNVHRAHGHTWAAFHVSNLTAGPADPALVKG